MVFENVIHFCYNLLQYIETKNCSKLIGFNSRFCKVCKIIINKL